MKYAGSGFWKAPPRIYCNVQITSHYFHPLSFLNGHKTDNRRNAPTLTFQKTGKGKSEGGPSSTVRYPGKSKQGKSPTYQTYPTKKRGLVPFSRLGPQLGPSLGVEATHLVARLILAYPFFVRLGLYLVLELQGDSRVQRAWIY